MFCSAKYPPLHHGVVYKRLFFFSQRASKSIRIRDRYTQRVGVQPGDAPPVESSKRRKVVYYMTERKGKCLKKGRQR